MRQFWASDSSCDEFATEEFVDPFGGTKHERYGGLIRSVRLLLARFEIVADSLVAKHRFPWSQVREVNRAMVPEIPVQVREQVRTE